LETVYDWITITIFGGLVVLFLHRSVSPDAPRDTILQYMPPAVGCAAANYFGNEGEKLANQDLKIVSFVIVVAVLAYIAVVLKPFGIKLWR
jgi:hypothetical protein